MGRVVWKCFPQITWNCSVTLAVPFCKLKVHTPGGYDQLASELGTPEEITEGLRQGKYFVSLAENLDNAEDIEHEGFGVIDP